MTDPAQRRGGAIDIPSVPNLRDVGGQPTRDGGRVRTGLLYRSGALGGLTDADMAAFERLGIRRVYDLRGGRERVLSPDRLPPAAETVVGDVLADWTAGGTDWLFALVDDPEAARRALGGGRLEALWLDQYRAFVTLPSAHAAFGRIFRDVAQAANRPALIHCTGGKDRSGWAAASLLLLLDVPEDVVMDDFLRSNLAAPAMAAHVTGPIVGHGGDPDLWRPLFIADPRCLEAAQAQVRESYGSIEAYFADALGVDGEAQDALRAAFADA
jgi:protein-tyrosine phosphatase